MCTAKGDDGAACTENEQCAHTCIDGTCAPASDLGGDCDVDVGAGGADGAGPGPTVGGNGGAGGDAGVPQNPDCKAPLQCFGGKCLTPDGEACTDDADCVNTCVSNVCQPKSGLDGKCDATADCDNSIDGVKLTCDQNKKLCKLDLTSLCQTNAQCQSNRCICADATCSTRACKTPDSVCQCKYSQANAETCDNGSPNLNKQIQDPNGCTGANFCNGGQCVPNDGGACTIQCVYHPATTDNMGNQTAPAYCSSNGPTACKAGYTGTPTSDCTIPKGTQTCTASCQCQLN
jgi:hypothetical protein